MKIETEGLPSRLLSWFFLLAILCMLWKLLPVLLIGLGRGVTGWWLLLAAGVVAFMALRGLAKASDGDFSKASGWLVLPACLLLPWMELLYMGGNFRTVHIILASVVPLVYAIVACMIIVGRALNLVLAVAVALPLTFVIARVAIPAVSFENGCLTQPVRWQVEREDDRSIEILFEAASEPLIYPASLKPFIVLQKEDLQGQPLALPPVAEVEFRLLRQKHTRSSGIYQIQTTRIGPYSASNGAEFARAGAISPIMELPLQPCSELALRSLQMRGR